MEILAPCGDEDSFWAAVNNGADAIYLGLGDFNARAKSTFFTTENIRHYVKIAHLFGVKVYVTTNTILLDNELDAFLDFAKKCVAAKVDAFIIQDLAVAEIFKKNFSNVVLHASTQMGIHNVAGATIAKKLGFSRVVLSRETKLSDIKLIKQTGIEIEYFVQGALCVSFSGNCYLSEYEQNKSGNRGKCAQLCRMPYTALLNGKEIGSGYLLSARDLCLIENLADLKKAGVDSLKIEGRLRRAGYVAQTVTSYRHALDNGNCDLTQEKHKLKKVFSRGDFLTRAYLDSGTPNNVINPKIQNHLGVEIGKVKKTQPFKDLTKIWIESSYPIHPNDGLKLLDGEEEKGSLGVGNVERDGNNYVIYSKAAAKPNYRVFLTLDSENEKSLTSTQRKLNITAFVKAKENEKLCLTLTHEKFAVMLESDYICPKANSSPTSENELKTQIGKLNDTYFMLENFETEIDNVFIPKSVINQLRRDAIAKLEEKMITNNEAHITAKEKKTDYTYSFSHPTPQHNIYYFDEDTDLDSFSFDSPILIFSPQSYELENIKAHLNRAKQYTKNIGLNLPLISNGKDYLILEKIISTLPTETIFIAQNIGHIDFLSRYKLNMIAGENLNVGNSLSASIYLNLGVSDIIFSKEFPSSIKTYKVVKGNETLMNFAHCPFKTLFNNSCNNCTFNKNLEIVGSRKEKYHIKRYRLSQCYFTMKAPKPEKPQLESKLGNVVDLT